MVEQIVVEEVIIHERGQKILADRHIRPYEAGKIDRVGGRGREGGREGGKGGLEYGEGRDESNWLMVFLPSSKSGGQFKPNRYT